HVSEARHGAPRFVQVCAKEQPQILLLPPLRSGSLTMTTHRKESQPTRSAESFSFLARSPGSRISLIWPAAYWARRFFLSNFPTLVLGTSGMKAQRSGIHHLATREARCARRM